MVVGGGAHHARSSDLAAPVDGERLAAREWPRRARQKVRGRQTREPNRAAVPSRSRYKIVMKFAVCAGDVDALQTHRRIGESPSARPDPAASDAVRSSSVVSCLLATIRTCVSQFVVLRTLLVLCSTGRAGALHVQLRFRFSFSRQHEPD